MELVTIDQVRPGHIVATAVTMAGGAVLCPMGFTLTAAAIERLRNAGIDAVVIERSLAADNSTLDKRLDLVRERFAGVEDPILLQIKATIEHRLNCMKLE